MQKTLATCAQVTPDHLKGRLQPCQALYQLLQDLNCSVVYCALIQRTWLERSTCPIHQVDCALDVYQIISNWPYISIDNRLAMSCLHVHIMFIGNLGMSRKYEVPTCLQRVSQHHNIIYYHCSYYYKHMLAGIRS